MTPQYVQTAIPSVLSMARTEEYIGIRTNFKLRSRYALSIHDIFAQ